MQEFRDGSENGTIEANEAVATYLAGPRGVEYREDGNGVRSWYLYDGLGHTADSDTGLIYMRARYYDPAIGRFISEDPAADGANWYAYCTDDPVNMSDASGKDGDLTPKTVAITIILNYLYDLLKTAAAKGAVNRAADFLCRTGTDFMGKGVEQFAAGAEAVDAGGASELAAPFAAAVGTEACVYGLMNVVIGAIMVAMSAIIRSVDNPLQYIVG